MTPIFYWLPCQTYPMCPVSLRFKKVAQKQVWELGNTHDPFFQDVAAKF